MGERAMTNTLVCTWAVVTDNNGRAHIEASWAPMSVTGAVAAPHAA